MATMRRMFLEYNRFIFNGLLFRKNSAPEIMINTATFHREMASYTFAISQSVDGYEHKKGTTDACSNKTEKIAKTLRLSKAMILLFGIRDNENSRLYNPLIYIRDSF